MCANHTSNDNYFLFIKKSNNISNEIISFDYDDDKYVRFVRASFNDDSIEIASVWHAKQIEIKSTVSVMMWFGSIVVASRVKFKSILFN